MMNCHRGAIYTNSIQGQTEEIGETPTSGYGFGPYAQEPPPQNIPPPPSQYPPAGQYYPQTVNFPPPPNIYSPTPNNPIQPPYNSTYGAEHGYTPPLGALPGEEPYGYPSQQGPYPRDQRYHPGNNVSAPSATPEHSEYTGASVPTRFRDDGRHADMLDSRHRNGS